MSKPDPYSPDELPGVIARLKDACDLARIGPWDTSRLLRIKSLFVEEVPRLLATVEALAADAAKHMTHLYYVASNGGFTGTNSPDGEAAEKYLCELLRVDEDGLFDKIQDYAARKD